MRRLKSFYVDNTVSFIHETKSVIIYLIHLTFRARTALRNFVALLKSSAKFYELKQQEIALTGLTIHLE